MPSCPTVNSAYCVPLLLRTLESYFVFRDPSSERLWL